MKQGRRSFLRFLGLGAIAAPVAALATEAAPTLYGGPVGSGMTSGASAPAEPEQPAFILHNPSTGQYVEIYASGRIALVHATPGGSGGSHTHSISTGGDHTHTHTMAGSSADHTHGFTSGHAVTQHALTGFTVMFNRIPVLEAKAYMRGLNSPRTA